jgi:hypothetical protein
LKPLSVTLPFAARFTAWGDSEPCAKCIQQSSESENRDSGERAKRRRWRGFRSRFQISGRCRTSEQNGLGDGGRKNGADKQPYIPFDWVLEFYLESAANQHGRASVFFPVVLTCRSLRPKSGRCEGGLAREMAASAFYRASLRSHRRVEPVSGYSIAWNGTEAEAIGERARVVSDCVAYPRFTGVAP